MVIPEPPPQHEFASPESVRLEMPLSDSDDYSSFAQQHHAAQNSAKNTFESDVLDAYNEVNSRGLLAESSAVGTSARSVGMVGGEARFGKRIQRVEEAPRD